MKNFDEDGNFIETDSDLEDIKEKATTVNYILKKKKSKRENDL
jgi:hypothetical protein